MILLEILMIVTINGWAVASGDRADRSRGSTPRLHRDVPTKQGVVRGYRNYDWQHYEFLGIPYTHPPLRNDRYKAPGLPPKWDGIFEATHKVHCPQPEDRASDENCLIVNVFAPVNSEDFPVVVLVHGGEFIKGWGDTKVHKILLKENFVTVTFNYRLGVLGFLCLGEEAEGNFGLKDQIAALVWVQENISKFGGNPNKVTLYGLGTGAASVHLLILSGRLKNLIHRAILESGSAISQTILSNDPTNNARKAGKFIGLDDNATVLDILHKFQKAKLTILADLANRNEKATFLPCVEDSNNYYVLIDKDPMISMQEPVYNHIPLLFVYTNLEGNIDYKHMEINNLSDILPNNLEVPNEDIKNKLLEIIKEFYVKSDSLKQITNYFRDIATYPILKSTLLHARNGEQPVYVMEFSYDNDIKLNNTTEGILRQLDNDLGMDKELLSTRLVLLYSNFIRFGDPTPLRTSLVPIIWEPVAREIDSVVKMKVLKFGKRMSVGKPASIKRMEFWEQVYLLFYKYHKMYLIDEED